MNNFHSCLDISENDIKANIFLSGCNYKENSYTIISDEITRKVEFEPKSRLPIPEFSSFHCNFFVTQN